MLDCIYDDNFWSENVIEDAQCILRWLGFSETNIMWSGFWCQDDGAAFIGDFRAKDYEAGRLAAEYGDERLKELDAAMAAFVARCPEATGTVRRSSYPRNLAVCYNLEPWSEYEEDEFLRLVQDGLRDGLESTFKSICENMMHWIYTTLEKEYDYQTSDEAVVESIETNDYDFDEDGERK